MKYTTSQKTDFWLGAKNKNTIYCIFSLSRLNSDLVTLCFLLHLHPGVMETKQEKHKRCDGPIVMWGTGENEGPLLKNKLASDSILLLTLDICSTIKFLGELNLQNQVKFVAAEDPGLHLRF